MRLQQCSVTQFQVVYPHLIVDNRNPRLADDRETWAAKGHDCSYDWEGRAWNAKKIAPGDWVRIRGDHDPCLSRGKGCRPQGMVIAVVGNDYLILWSGDAHVDRHIV